MKYPYIGKLKENNEGLVLFVGESFGAQLNSKGGGWYEEEIGIYSTTEKWDEREFTNITREYLANNAIKIESQEHLDFLYKIAGVHKLNIGPVECRIFDSNYPYFVNIRNYVFHVSENQAKLEGKTLITIPLPPKEPEPKDWPQVGDDVVTASKLDATVIAIDNCEAWVKYKGKITTKGYGSVAIATLTKPLTPEEELARLIYGLGSANTDYCEHIAKAIINGEIKGLSYKPE